MRELSARGLSVREEASVRARARTNSFHGRPLPPGLVSFSSREGKRRFGEALADGQCEAFFPLSEQFITQDEPAFCGLSSLCMVLNALRVDPGPTRPAWREDGVWRWFDERVLALDAPLLRDNGKRTLDQIQTDGVTLDEFSALASRNGALIQQHRPADSSLAQFREQIIQSASSPTAPHMVVSFCRGTLQQTGDGHFSPIAGYHMESDSVLVLDVARFKYPPYWVSVSTLWDAMAPVDEVTGDSRGYVLLRAEATCPMWDRWKLEQDKTAQLDVCIMDLPSHPMDRAASSSRLLAAEVC